MPVVEEQIKVINHRIETWSILSIRSTNTNNKYNSGGFDMEFSDFAAVPAIVVLVYLAAYFIKLIQARPSIGCCPRCAGFWGLYWALCAISRCPALSPAENWLTAAAVGIVSGFAATGVNQIYKQASKGKAAEIKRR